MIYAGSRCAAPMTSSEWRHASVTDGHPCVSTDDRRPLADRRPSARPRTRPTAIVPVSSDCTRPACADYQQQMAAKCKLGSDKGGAIRDRVATGRGARERSASWRASAEHDPTDRPVQRDYLSDTDLSWDLRVAYKTRLYTLLLHTHTTHICHIIIISYHIIEDGLNISRNGPG